MKVLIVDDNVAVQEIIRDILSDEGHIVRVAGTVDEAVEKIGSFEPEVVILDSQVADEEGLHVVSRAAEEYPGVDFGAILLKSPGELSPKDDPHVKGFVDKPFKSADILAAVRDLAEAEAEEAAEEAVKGKPKRRSRLFGRRQRRHQELPPGPAGGLEFGRSYVIFEHEPEEVYGFVDFFQSGHYDILVITSERAKAIKERFNYGCVEVVALTSSGRGGTMDIHMLGTLMARMAGFINAHDRPVIIIDRFGEIIDANGINASLTMLDQVIGGRARDCTIAVSVDGDRLTDKDRGIFLHRMSEYKVKE